MACRTWCIVIVLVMYVDIVPNRTSKPAILLRENWREDGKVRKRTLANLSDLSVEQALVLRRVLKGETLVAPEDAFDVTASLPHGHVQAVLLAMKNLGISNLLASRPSKERAVVTALIAYRVLNPKSKLATTRAWHATTLPSELGVEDVNEDDVYRAMDWLVSTKNRIETKLAARHVNEGSRVLTYVSSSYVEGEPFDLAAFGYNRDGKKGKMQVNWSLMTDEEGRPICVNLHPGNTSDPTILTANVEVLRERFGVQQFTLVGDRGMITSKHVPHLAHLQASMGIDWITALKSQSLKKLVIDGALQPSMVGESNILEVTHDAYPGERLIAGRNPVLGRKRAHKRQELLAATDYELSKIQARVQAGRLKGREKIGLKVGAKLGRYDMAKHVHVTITDDDLTFTINEASVTQEASMDGIYVIRTSVPSSELTRDDAVRAYKSLAQVERAFLTMKSIDLHVRPIHHRREHRVTAHFFLCMLAHYVRWHMERALAPLTFKDETPSNDRDPVAPATRSSEANRKAQSATLDDGTPTRTFNTLLHDLATITRNTCTHPATGATFPMTTKPNPHQQQALDLLDTITV